jgi:hypothetical protein
MTITAIRQRLISYLEDADENKVKAIYTLVEEDIENADVVLSHEQLSILDQERELFIKDESKALSMTEALQFIRTGN